MSCRVVKESITITRDKTIYICDGCGRETSVPLCKCFLCEKEFCPDCYIRIRDCHMFWHGYNDICCNSCWDVGKDTRELLDTIEQEFTDETAYRINRWKELVSGVGCDEIG